MEELGEAIAESSRFLRRFFAAIRIKGKALSQRVMCEKHHMSKSTLQKILNAAYILDPNFPVLHEIVESLPDKAAQMEFLWEYHQHQAKVHEAGKAVITAPPDSEKSAPLVGG
jgi:hypothetical protein